MLSPLVRIYMGCENNERKGKIVLVAGTFDILHESHINMLRNARNLGDRLVVMLSTDEFNETKGRGLSRI